MRYYLEGLDGGATANPPQDSTSTQQTETEQHARRPRTAQSHESSFWGEGNAGVFFGDISESDEEEDDAEEEEDDEEESDDEDEEDDDEDDGVGSQFGDRDAFPVEDEDDLRLPGHI
jgi:hypothetical protein